MTADKNVVVAINRGRGLVHAGHRALRHAGVSAVRPPLQSGSSINIDEQLKALFPANMQMQVQTCTELLIIAIMAKASSSCIELLVKFVDEAHHAKGPHRGCLSNQEGAMMFGSANKFVGIACTTGDSLFGGAAAAAAAVTVRVGPTQG